MKNKTYYNILTMLAGILLGVSANAAPLNFECDIKPAPLQTDCPDDEFHSLGFYPPFEKNYTGNPEDYSNGYQWGADYMNFGYAWYYTYGTARIGVLDVPPDFYDQEIVTNYRAHSSGTFAMPGNTFAGITNTFTTNITAAQSGSHGMMTIGLLNAKSDNFDGISGLCRECSLGFVTPTGTSRRNFSNQEYDLVKVIDPDTSTPLYDDCNLIPPLSDRSLTLSRKGFKCSQEALDFKLQSFNNSISHLINSGNQVINFSLQFAELTDLKRVDDAYYRYQDNPNNPLWAARQWELQKTHPDRDVYPDCASQAGIYGFSLDICNTLDAAKARDVIVVASAGNNLKNQMAWPASEVANVIGVAGTDPSGRLWDRRVVESGCNTPNSTSECGSNFDPVNTLFAAPAHNVLVYHPYGDYNSAVGCYDANIQPINDGYQLCSGTSFSAPYVSSIVAMIRSINPLISFDDVKQVLWDSRVTGLTDQRYAIPKANKSIKIALGTSHGDRVVNRLTPMFRLKTNASNQNFPGHISYLSTTIPQIATAAKLGSYLVNPKADTGEIYFNDVVRYSSDANSQTTPGYSKFKGTGETARAPFYVFGGHRNPFNDSADLLPVYHMARSRFYGGDCTELADHAYATVQSTGFNFGSNFCGTHYMNYVKEGIDGYILPECPAGVNCYDENSPISKSNKITWAQCVKVRYSQQDKSFALMMASEVNEPMFQSYGTTFKNNLNQTVSITSLSGMLNAECLGYVFPNIDSDNDGVIDGMELVLGTNPNDPDTDNDGKSDGAEYPLTGIPLSDPRIND